MTMTEVIYDELNKDGKHSSVKLVALSGPTHAEEVALDMPSSIVSACTDEETVSYTHLDVYKRQGAERCFSRGILKSVG